LAKQQGGLSGWRSVLCLLFTPFVFRKLEWSGRDTTWSTNSANHDRRQKTKTSQNKPTTWGIEEEDILGGQKEERRSPKKATLRPLAQLQVDSRGERTITKKGEATPWSRTRVVSRDAVSSIKKESHGHTHVPGKRDESTLKSSARERS